MFRFGTQDIAVFIQNIDLKFSVNVQNLSKRKVFFPFYEGLRFYLYFY